MTDLVARIVNNPSYHDVLAILKGARNGFVSLTRGTKDGVKVRFPHALVMSILFSSADYRTRARTIYRATSQHAINLAKYVTIYKTALLLQRSLNKGKRRGLDSFFAGLIGGYAVFGDRNPVSEQIVMYVLSRVVTSFLPRDRAALEAASKSPPKPALPPDARVPPGYPYPKPIPPSSRVFEIYAALTWGMVMYLFEHNRENLQGGMVNSMQYLYLDSEVWDGIRTLLWHNK